MSRDFLSSVTLRLQLLLPVCFPTLVKALAALEKKKTEKEESLVLHGTETDLLLTSELYCFGTGQKKKKSVIRLQHPRLGGKVLSKKKIKSCVSEALDGEELNIAGITTCVTLTGRPREQYLK